MDGGAQVPPPGSKCSAAGVLGAPPPSSLSLSPLFPSHSQMVRIPDGRLLAEV